MKWPKLKRDCIGSVVKLLKPKQTAGGVKFGRGTKMVVHGYYRGLSLRDRRGRSITRVQIYDVELVPSFENESRPKLGQGKAA